MRHMLTFAAALGLGSLGLYACSSSPTPATTTDAGADAGPALDSGKTDSGKADAGPVQGTSCANAIPAALGTELDGEFTNVGQSTFYSVDVTAGDFMIFAASTAATPDSDTVVDTAISVFDSTGKKLIAADDDAFPRYATDAEVVYRAASTAALCVQVTDFDTWGGTTAKLASDSAFKFFAGKFDPTAASVTADVEPNDTIATAQTGKLKAFTTPPGASGFIFGSLKDAADVDTYKFTVPAGTSSMGVTVPPIGAPLAAGKTSFGSTMARFTATVKKLDGTTIAELTPPTGQVELMSTALTAPITAGDYYLVISRPAGIAAGANDFYYAPVDFTKGNPLEAEVASGSNDTLATAEAVTMTVDKTNAKQKDGFLMAHLPTGDAADNFSFSVAVGDTVSIACGAARNGSGLTAFKAELFVAGASTQAEAEIPTIDLYWSAGKTATKPAVKVTTAGTAVLQLTTGGRSSTNLGTYYLCGVHVTSL